MIPVSRHAPDREREVLAWAVMTAKRWRGTRVSPEDILGGALLGAAKALARYDGREGVEFRSYALKLIIAEIQEELRRWDHLSRDYRVKARAEEAATGKPPEWAAPPLWLSELIDESDDDDDGLERAAVLADPEEDAQALALARLERAEWLRVIGWLTKQQREAILGLYYDGERLVDVARAAGCKNSTMDARHAQALRRLRQWAEEGLVAP